MELNKLINEETIILPLTAQSKDECIEKMADRLFETGVVKDRQLFIKAVMHRETEGTTGIGFGVAIPHGKSNGVARPGLAFSRLEPPLDWDSLDGEPVTMVFLIAVPEENAGDEHLKILASLSRKLIHAEFRDQLLQAKSAAEILDIIAGG